LAHPSAKGAIISSILGFKALWFERLVVALIYFRKNLRHMKRVLGGCMIVFTLMACGSEEQPVTPQKATFQLSDIAGMYQDTLPVPNAVNKIVQLTIHDDSTYSMVERTMYYNDPVVRPITSAGKVEIVDQGQKLKLSSRVSADKLVWLAQAQGQLTLLDSIGNSVANSGNYPMERISSSVAKVGNDRLWSIDKGTVRYPLNVYGRPGGSDLSVASYYLRTCSEAECALTAYYVHSFQGKMEGMDPLQLILKKDTEALKSMTQRLVSNATGSPISLNIRQETLTSLVFSKVKEQTMVMYTYLDANDKNWIGKDLYNLENGRYLLISQGIATEMK
jgi:hypothetical protein